MKTIREKAEEYAFIKQGMDPFGIKFRELDTKKQNGFEAGANYVLECIEESIKNSPAGYGLIYYIIEQLKK